MKTLIATKLVTAALLGGAALLPLAAHADVNGYLRHDNARIQRGLETGQITVRQARALRTRDVRIVRQERRDHFFDGGPLSVSQRRQLDRELNGTTRTIRRDEFRNDF